MTLKSTLGALLIGASALSFIAFPAAAIAKEATAQASEQFGPKVSSYTLDNGLQVVVIPDRRAPVVTHMVWYKAGSADEDPGVSGIAHYLEHLMFKGTKTTKEGEFSARIAAIGGQENAFTSSDYTAYFQRVTPAALEDMMRFEADRMENLVLDQQGILAERSVVNEERNQRTENNPGSLLREALSAALYQNHRYGIPVIGWKHEVNALTKEDAIAFYDKYYTPNNAILVVAGDVDPEKVLELAKKTYGKVERRAEPGKRVRPSEPEPRAARRIIMQDRRVTTPSMQRMYLVPSYTTAEGREAEALDVLSEVLGGGTTGRLYRKLVVEDKVAGNVSVWYQGGSLDSTEFGFWGQPRAATTVDDVEGGIDAVIAELLENGVTQKEIERAQKRLIRSAVFAQDSQATLARIYGGSLAVGQTLEDIQDWPQEINSVTVEDVNAAARKYLKPRRSVTGHLLPEDSKEG